MSTSTSSLFGRKNNQQLPIATHGDGAYLYDTEGKRYLDACCGAAVSCLGHNNQAAIEAAKKQLDQLAYAHTGFFTSEPAEALATKLTELAPSNISKAYFVSGGSEAVEAAIKLARQYFIEIDQPQRQHFIARKQSYHGNTLGALSAGGNAWRRAPFAPLLAPTMHHIDACHYYRFAEPHETEYDYGQRVANQLEDKILDLGPDQVCAFIAEPVVGATMGAVPAVAWYFQRIREICDRYGVLLILDEIMCGMGRTGTLFACEQEAILPDIITVAKGLGAGIQPIGAMLCTDQIYSAISAGSGYFQHGHTYLAHATVCASSLAVLEQISQPAMLKQVNAMGDVLSTQLKHHLADHPNVGDIRGRGLFWGIELVADKASKATLDPKAKTHAQLKQLAMHKGLMVYPMGGTVDGQFGDHVLLAPPFIITAQQIDFIARTLRDCLDELLA